MRPPSFANILVMALLVFAILSLWAKVGSATDTYDPATFYTDCWEACFNYDNAVGGTGSGTGGTGTGTGTGDGSLKNEYDALYAMIEAARTERLLSGSNSTIFAIDATYSSDPSVILFQKLLAELVLLATPNTANYNPATIVLYDGTHAWTQLSWANLGRCDAIAVLEGLGDPTVPGGSTQYTQSNSLGQIDLACLSGANQLGLLTPGMLANPGSFTNNPIVFGFANSPIATYETSCGPDAYFGSTGNDLYDQIAKEYNNIAGNVDLFNAGSDFKSYCSSLFGDQMIFGTGSADSSDLSGWSSISPDSVSGSQYVSNTPDFVTAAQQLVNCMQSACCPPPSRMATDYLDNSSCIQVDISENFISCNS